MNKKETIKKFEKLLDGFRDWSIENTKEEPRPGTKAVYYSEFLEKLVKTVDECGYKQGYDDAIKKIEEAIK